MTKRNTQAGFTLIELVTATAIAAGLAVVMLALGGRALDLAGRTMDDMRMAQTAQRVFDQLAEDLDGLAIRNDGRASLTAGFASPDEFSGVWVAGGKPLDQSLQLGDPAIANDRFGVASAGLKLLTWRAGSDVRSMDSPAPVAVSYQLIHRPLTASSPRAVYLFYRASATPRATLDAGLDLMAPAYRTPAEQNGAAGNLASPLRRQVLAENVIDFGLRLFTRQVSPDGEIKLIEIFPDGGAVPNYRFPPVAQSPVVLAPRVADVMLRVLSDRGARELAARETQLSAAEWWQLALRHSRVFTRRIALRAEGD